MLGLTSFAMPYKVRYGLAYAINSEGIINEFIRAASAGDVDTLKDLIDKYGEKLAAERHNAALIAAIKEEHTDVIKYLLTIDSVKRIMFNDGECQELTIEAIRGNKELNKLLLPCYQGKGGNLLTIGARLGSLDIAWRFATSSYSLDQKIEALNLAAKLGHLDIVILLLDDPVLKRNVHASNNLALPLAAGEGHLDIVKCLLENLGIRVNSAANNNEALRNAAKNHHWSTVEYLLTFDMPLFHAADGDNFVFLQALSHGQTRIVAKLLEIDSVMKLAASNEATFLAALKPLVDTRDFSLVKILHTAPGSAKYFPSDWRYRIDLFSYSNLSEDDWIHLKRHLQKFNLATLQPSASSYIPSGANTSQESGHSSKHSVAEISSSSSGSSYSSASSSSSTDFSSAYKRPSHN